MIVQIPQRCEMRPRGRIIVGRQHLNPLPVRLRSQIRPWVPQKNIGIQVVDNEDGELWEKRFNRWWGWSWLRKRKETLRKYGIKACTKDHFRAMRRVLQLRQTDSIPNHIRDYFNTPDNLSGREVTKSKKPNIRVTGHKFGDYDLESWAEEEAPSSTSSTKSVSVKMVPRKKFTVTDSLDHIARRLKRIGLKEKSNLDKKSSFINLNFTNITDCLKPININDFSYVPMPQFKYLNRFDMIKDEHIKFMKDLDAHTFNVDVEKDVNDQFEFITELKYKNIDHDITKNIEITNTLLNKLSVKDKLKCINASSNPFDDVKEEKSPFYDIKYIQNNIECFASQITYLNFLDRMHKIE